MAARPNKSGSKATRPNTFTGRCWLTEPLIPKTFGGNVNRGECNVYVRAWAIAHETTIAITLAMTPAIAPTDSGVRVTDVGCQR